MPSSPKNFRILRNSAQPAPSSAPQSAPEQDSNPQQVQMSHQRQAEVRRHAQQVQDQQPVAAPSDDQHNGAVAHQPTAREEIEQIKKENLTGRQLRIARRLAQRSNLSPTSDLDAVRLLRRQGIDPFGKQDIGNVLTPVDADSEPGTGVALPATVRKTAVSDHKPQVIDDDSREREVRKIQRDLVKRRRKRLGILILKLACYVMLPSMMAGYYFYKVATPMYATYTEFVIQSADAPGAAGAAGLFSGSPLETVTDSITVQGYLPSRDAMLRLDEKPGFRQLFQDKSVDVLQRLDPDATNEDAYKIYKKRVIIGFDPTEGVIKMEVVAPSPDASKAISQALISYAEEQVDQLTARLRGDQMTGAREIYEEAEAKMEAAYDEVARLQRQTATLDTAGENALIMGQIGELETQITSKQLELARLRANTRPNVTKVRVLEEEIQLLQGKVDEKRSDVSQGSGANDSLVDINADLNKAQSKLMVRQQLVAAALQNLESARIEASRQTRYISRGVSPVTPDKATYPRAFENTLLAIIVFAGIYLMLSLTVSILKEQVTT
nr:capsule biosynthesis protein [Amylibacter sp.]